jgi:hypothetical protein
MNNLTKSLISELVGDNVVTAVYGGGFKPPTKGHFEVVQKALAEFPEIDKFIIYVGSGERNGITQEESLLIWEIYKKYLGDKVEIQPSKAPIGDILRYAKNNPEEVVYFVIGARQGNEDDLKDVALRTSGVEDKYPNAKIKLISTPGDGMSGTNARKAAKISPEDFYKYLPSNLSDDEKMEVFSYIQDIVTEAQLGESFIKDLKSKFNKFISAIKQESKETKKAVSLLIKSAKGDIELTDEQKKEIGEQLKDVLKLIGLTAIATLPGGFIAAALIKLFKAEYLVTPSSMMAEIVTATDIICDNCGWEWAIKDGGDDLYICHKCGHDNNPKQLNENASYSKDIDIIEKCAKLTNYMRSKGYKIDPVPSVTFINGDTENARDFFGKTAYYDPNKKEIVLYTEGRHPKDIVRSFAHEMIHHIQNLEGRLGNITTTNTQEDDHLNGIEAEANLKGTMSFRNWTDSLNEGLLNETPSEVQVKKINISFELFDGTKISEDITLAMSPNSQGLFELGDNIEKYTGLSLKDAQEYNETPDDAYIYGLVNTMNDGQDIYFWTNGTRLAGKAKKLGTQTAIIEQLAHEGLHLTRAILAKSLMGDKFPTGEWPSMGEQDNDTIEEEQLTTALSFVIEHITPSFIEMAKEYIPELNDQSISENLVNEGLNEKKEKDPFGLNQYARELAQGLEETFINEGVYDSIVSKLSKDVLNAWKSQFDAKPTRLFSVLDTNYEMEDAKGRPMEFDLLAKLDFKKTKDRTYKVDGGANEGDDENEGFIALNFSVDPRELPQMWSTIAMDIRDVLRHELEHLTQGGWNVRSDKEMEDDQVIRDLIQKYKLMAPKNYFMLDKEVDAMLQGMYFKAKKSRTPFVDVIDDYLDKVGLEPEEKEEIKTRWRGRLKALSLPMFETKYKLGKVLKEEETEQKYTIYCDMDGVLTDFDKQFEKASGGIPPREYEEKNGKEAFWNLIDNENGVGFWVGMPWMPNGQTLWNYIKQYNPTLLSAPSRQNESRLGKRLWVKKNIPGTKLILANAENKQNYANDKSILIDDRPSNIEQWRSKGGIGILFISTEQTIKELKELGL